MRKILSKIYNVMFSLYNIDIFSDDISISDHKVTNNIEDDVNSNVNSAFRY